MTEMCRVQPTAEVESICYVYLQMSSWIILHTAAGGVRSGWVRVAEYQQPVISTASGSVRSRPTSAVRHHSHGRRRPKTTHNLLGLRALGARTTVAWRRHIYPTNSAAAWGRANSK